MQTYTQTDVDHLIKQAEHDGWKKWFNDCAEMSWIKLSVNK